MKISVFGIGYVGAVTSACLAESGNEVIAVDTDPVKISRINEGKSPIVEPGLEELIAENVRQGRLKATADAREAVLSSDVSLICVGTPSHEDGSLNLQYVRESARGIGNALQDKQEFHAVVLRSTVIPGTSRKSFIPVLEESSGKKAGEDFGFGYNPEFLREGTAIRDYYSPPKIVIGATDERTAYAISKLYENLYAPEAITSVDVAEGVKYADNAWHALKVGFANEIGNILKEHGVDSHKVMDIFCLDTKLNISAAYLKPGFAFGGSCLPKDVRALCASARQKNLKTPILDSLLESNAEQVRRAHRMALAAGKRKIGLMGLSFKSGTDDLRESPLVALADMLLKDGIDLAIYDPNVYKASRMEGATEKYMREDIAHISSRLVETPEQLLEKSDGFVIGNDDESFEGILSKVNGDAPVIDLVRIKNANNRKSYEGICW